jgi:hypothetical protein
MQGFPQNTRSTSGTFLLTSKPDLVVWQRTRSPEEKGDYVSCLISRIF